MCIRDSHWGNRRPRAAFVVVPACYREPMSNFADIACPASPQLESATTASPDGRPKDSATFAGSRSRKTPDVPEGEMHGHGSGGPKDVWTHNVEATASLLIAFGTLITTCLLYTSRCV